MDADDVDARFTEHGRRVLASQPFSVLVGLELTRWNGGEVELTLPITPQLRQQHGFVHGGVIAYLADNALAFAGGGALGPSVVSSEMKLNFLRPAVGDKLIARGWVVSAGRRQAVARCDIVVADGERVGLCAAAQGTISRLDEGWENPLPQGAPIVA